MTGILIYGDKPEAANELVVAGAQFAAALGLYVCAAGLGPGAEASAAGLATHGADRVYLSEDPALEGLHPETVADALAQIAGLAGASHLLISSTRRGKELAGRLAQKLAAGAITDAKALVVADGDLFGARYALGGNTVVTERIDTAVKVFAVMPKSFEVGEPRAGAGEIIRPSLSLSPSSVKVVDRRAREAESVHLDAAPRIVGVGRGFARREDLALGQALAAALEAELGCSKSVADLEWLPEEHIIGLSGAKTSPDFYLALGISGQVQHTVGINQAKMIAAVNTDKDAPIFELADYGIVGDIYQVVPALLEKLKSQ
ncbi:MAG: electron transfer flavoprotein subunit alpha/FixB family protein [Acidimicrobiales bacterium]|jgi:electron transfer flavoprotein alpha subunit